MDNKVILISIDGMRPDAFTGCGNPFYKELLENSTYYEKSSFVECLIKIPMRRAVNRLFLFGTLTSMQIEYI